MLSHPLAWNRRVTLRRIRGDVLMTCCHSSPPCIGWANPFYTSSSRYTTATASRRWDSRLAQGACHCRRIGDDRSQTRSRTSQSRGSHLCQITAGPYQSRQVGCQQLARPNIVSRTLMHAGWYADSAWSYTDGTRWILGVPECHEAKSTGILEGEFKDICKRDCT